ncbi:guanosine nucleotide diphosphate dissociation inhibitor 2 [Pyrus ussuriensis x Pyrus communis]|uniref:Guanosine nucleotide diphosphate dissociation inhibitor n=1 Tax=Pyrus ussuriensis x Pyrus communis TaxID=2448454 RepID=A0A5N5I5N2_9ROSA|nr:guanosine nucleotide diphosphate dissociation inhibitor 2 [Pyrus ussuriensis x Pyrus communis]
MDREQKKKMEMKRERDEEKIRKKTEGVGRRKLRKKKGMNGKTDHPETELKPGIDLLGPIDEIFFKTYDRCELVNEPNLDNCFISTSYDASTHFECTVLDVLNMYTLITGKVLDLSVDLSAASVTEE